MQVRLRRLGKACLIRSPACQDSPGDPGQLVGECDDDHVAVHAALQLGEPRAEALTVPHLAAQHRLRPQDEQAPEMGVAALADAQEARLPTRRMLPGDEPEPSGEVPSVRKRAAVADGGDDGSRRDRTEPRYLHQPLTVGIPGCDGDDLGRDPVDLLVELTPFLRERAEQPLQAWRDPGGFRCEESPQLAAQRDPSRPQWASLL